MNVKRKINYKITEASNFIYHVLSQVDAKKEWGPANVYNDKYISKTKHKIKMPKDVAEILIKIDGPFAFFPLSSRYSGVRGMLFSLLKSDSLNKLLYFFKEKGLTRGEKEMLYKFLLEEYNSFYKKFWIKNQNNFSKRSVIFRENVNSLFDKYLNFLAGINHEKNMPQVNIYLIDSLGRRGKGLYDGCAIGLPHNKAEAQENIVKAMHEITHNYTDDILAKLHFPIKVKPTDLKNHSRKEEVVNYYLQNFLNKNKIFNKKYSFEINYDLLPIEIKDAPGL